MVLLFFGDEVRGGGSRVKRGKVRVNKKVNNTERKRRRGRYTGNEEGRV